MKKHLTIAIAIVAACALPVVAQSGAGGTDTLSALLTEVRALRVAMERAASTTPQIQLLAARLTVQNERLARVSRDADAAQQELERIESQTASMSSRAGQIEEALSRESDPARQRELKAEQTNIKSELEDRTAQEVRVRGREAELASLVAVEQAQWVELNRRLDELERELSARRPQ
jgi:predicted  nucleic acid-binding Zn-ribbon protein